MTSADDILDEVDQLLSAVKPDEAEGALALLIGQLGPDELRVWEADLRKSIEAFLPKRRRRLTEMLTAALSTSQLPPVAAKGTASAISADMRGVLDHFRNDLADLSDYHIFQWSTWYRDSFAQFSDDFLEATHRGLSSNPVPSDVVRDLVADHAVEIFTKGYDHTTHRGDQSLALIKARGGLQRFLDIPIEYYSAALARGPIASEAVALRKLVSGELAGVILGFAQCQFGPQTGGEVLLDKVDQWVHVLAFLTGPDMSAIKSTVGASSGDMTLSDCAVFADGVDRFVSASRSFAPLPSLAEYRPHTQVLEVTFGVGGTSSLEPVFTVVALGDGSLTQHLLEEALGKGAKAVVGTTSEFARALLAGDTRYDGVVVDSSRPQPADALVNVLRLAAFRAEGGTKATQPLRYNFSRDFPIGNPFLTRYYRVDRPSVRDLLRTVERRNGVRLWCSVRRSGKTTAGLDLASASSDVDVITQTCDDTGQIPEEQVLYNRVVSALEDGRHIRSSFLSDTLIDCGSPDSRGEGRKRVLVLDEYETLFGTLASEAQADQRLRYSVVQPLLNQFVSFSRDNLVVFLGQQPTAHHILMDQNQLSPYVLQDHFPLFRASTARDEFAELVSKILTSRVMADEGFVQSVFAETAGHPFITVNLLVELVDWLIALKRPVGKLNMTRADFEEFGAARLTKSALRESATYQFFRDGVIGEALGGTGKEHTPWLHTVYGMLRTICLESPSSFSMSRSEFAELFRQSGYDKLGVTPDYILTTARSANFLEYDGEQVAPKIRLLGRLATVAPIRLGRV